MGNHVLGSRSELEGSASLAVFCVISIAKLSPTCNLTGRSAASGGLCARAENASLKLCILSTLQTKINKHKVIQVLHSADQHLAFLFVSDMLTHPISCSMDWIIPTACITLRLRHTQCQLRIGPNGIDCKRLASYLAIARSRLPD